MIVSLCALFNLPFCFEFFFPFFSFCIFPVLFFILFLLFLTYHISVSLHEIVSYHLLIVKIVQYLEPCAKIMFGICKIKSVLFMNIRTSCTQRSWAPQTSPHIHKAECKQVQIYKVKTTLMKARGSKKESVIDRNIWLKKKKKILEKCERKLALKEGDTRISSGQNHMCDGV